MNPWLPVVCFWAPFFLTAALAVIGVIRTRGRLLLLPKSHWITLFAPYIFPFIFLAWGALFRWNGPEDAEPYWRVQVAVCLMLLVYPAFCVLSVWHSAGLRLLALALIPFSLLLSVVAFMFAVLLLVND